MGKVYEKTVYRKAYKNDSEKKKRMILKLWKDADSHCQWEMQIKTILEYHFLLFQLAKIPKLGNIILARLHRTVSFIIASRNAKCHKLYEGNWVASIKTIILYTLWSRNSTSGNLFMHLHEKSYIQS